MSRETSAVHEAILRAIIESPRDVIIFALDREYRYLLFNHAHRETMRRIWNVEIAVGQNMLDAIGRDDDRARAKQNFDRALAGEHFVVIEEYGEQRFSRRYYEDLYSPIRVDDGSIVGLTLFLTDITEQRRNEQRLEEYRQELERLVAERTSELRRSEELYRTLVTNAPISVLVHRGADIVYANPAAAVLAGQPRDADLTGRRIGELLGRRVEQELVDDGAVHEVMVERADGTRADVESRSIAVPFERGGASLSLVVDVSERKAAEAERRELEMKMFQSQKLESLGLLSGSVAHDFNNLLVGVLGNAEVALRDPTLSADTRQTLARIKTAAQRASELTTQLLAYTGKTSLIVRPLDLSAIAREMTDLVRMSVPKSARLELELASDLPAFEGDGAQVRQIVMNLVTNAAEAMGTARGEIRVRTYRTTGAAPATTGFGELEDGRTYVCLEVTDSGVGMDEPTRTRIFDPFFTTKPSGHGLGLAAVIGIVRAHRGAIRVTSEPGTGSTFRVYFPATDRAVEQASEPPSQEQPWRGSGTVLVGDDEPRVRQVLVLMLRQMGFRVIEAATAPECLDAFRASPEPVRVVLIDLTMPGGGGAEVVRALRADGHDVPVILSSGYPEDTIGPELRGDPRLTFLEKPFDYDTFTRVLRRAIERAG